TIGLNKWSPEDLLRYPLTDAFLPSDARSAPESVTVLRWMHPPPALHTLMPTPRLSAGNVDTSLSLKAQDTSLSGDPCRRGDTESLPLDASRRLTVLLLPMKALVEAPTHWTLNAPCVIHPSPTKSRGITNIQRTNTLEYYDHYCSTLLYSQRHVRLLQYSQRYVRVLQYSQRYVRLLQYSQRYVRLLQYSQRYVRLLQYSQRYSQRYVRLLQYSQRYVRLLQYSQRYVRLLQYSQRYVRLLQYSQRYSQRYVRLLQYSQ
ncbi:hypothetical protein KUCAC02_033965, partial [Chaenocephalus aceratus]